MDMFKMMKEAAAMRSRLAEMDRQLRDTIVDTEEHGVRIRLNAKSEVLDVKVTPEFLQQNQEKIEKQLLQAFQKAVKKSQEVMANEAKKLTGGLNIPGLM